MYTVQVPFLFSEMLNMLKETFEVMEMRTFKHKPFFIVGGMGGGGLIRGTLRYMYKVQDHHITCHGCVP